jgi:hypothetical protein
MLTVLSDGDGKYRLEDSNGILVSWINGRTICLRGFPTERTARDAAIVGWRALGETLRQEFAGWREYAPALDQLRTVHDGAYEWFYDGTTAIARLLRPQRRAFDSTFGLQFVLPSYATDGTVISAAHSVAFALAPYRDGCADRVGAAPDVPGAEPVPDRPLRA